MLLADLALGVHFAIAAFLVLGMVFIPLGAYWRWTWVRARRLRQIHLGLMILIAIEALFHITCPLTTLEAYLRNSTAPQSFWGHQLNKLLYWNLPVEFFTFLYLGCALWIMALWKYVSPNKKS